MSMAKELFLRKNTRFKRERCGHCRIPVEFCICPYTPQFNLPCSFNLITHSRELDKPTNTGVLLKLAVPGTPIHIWDRTKPSEDLIKSLESPEIEPFVVFPSSGSQVLTPNSLDIHSPGRSFILIDGTWKQARKIYNLSPYLNRLPALSIIPQKPSEYNLRTQNHPSGVSTIEVAIEIIRLMGLETPSCLLHAFFKTFNYYYKLTRQNRKVIEEPESLMILKRALDN